MYVAIPYYVVYALKVVKQARERVLILIAKFDEGCGLHLRFLHEMQWHYYALMLVIITMRRTVVFVTLQ